MKQFIDKFCRSYNVSPHSLEVLIGEMDFAVFQKGELHSRLYQKNMHNYCFNLTGYGCKKNIISAQKSL